MPGPASGAGSLRVRVPAEAVADHSGTSLRMIEANRAQFVPEDRARYAAVAAPPLRLQPAGDKVLPLRAGARR